MMFNWFLYKIILSLFYQQFRFYGRYKMGAPLVHLYPYNAFPFTL